MPSTDRRLELKAKDIDGSDRLTAGCVCQWVNSFHAFVCCSHCFLLLRSTYNVYHILLCNLYNCNSFLQDSSIGLVFSLSQLYVWCNN